jgi:mannosyltransferase OCH1-like enzyme
MWKVKDLDNLHRSCFNSWVKHHPDWIVKLYDDVELDTIIKIKLPDLYNRFAGCDGIKKSDAFRLGLVYVFGGLYVDIDTFCFKPIDSLVVNCDRCFFEDVKIEGGIYDYKPKFEYTNAIFYANPKDRMIGRIITDLIRYGDDDKTIDKNMNVILHTGPEFLSNCIKKYGMIWNIDVIGSDKFEWCDKMNRQSMVKSGKLIVNSGSYGLHLAVGSWIYGSMKFKYYEDVKDINLEAMDDYR